MKSAGKVSVTALVVAAVSLALAPASAIHPTPPYEEPLEGARVVHVGGGDLRNEVVTDLEVQFMAYYPETMQVHRGQTVEWRFPPGFASLHTVTFLPGDMDISRVPEPLESAHSDMFRADEIPQVVVLSEEVMLGYGCGLIYDVPTNAQQAQEPCHIDSTDRRYGSQVSDALFNFFQQQPQRFAAVIDLPVSKYRYHCKLHPSMNGYIEVVSDDVALPSRGEIDAEAKEDLEADHATAIDLHRALSKPVSTLEGDQRIWTVHTGATSADKRVSINDYLPADLQIEKGDAVRFVQEGVEPNTVTFPAESVGSFALEGCDTSSCEGHPEPAGLVWLAAPFVCEYDAPQSGLPGTPWVPGCPGGGQSEWQVGYAAAEPTHAPGDLVVTPTTFHNSAFLLDNPDLPEWYKARPGPRDWPKTFEASFPVTGTFKYSCLLHSGDPNTKPVTGEARRGMVGTIRVRS